MRDPTVDASAAAEDRRVEEAIKEAQRLLGPLTKNPLSWAIVGWHDPDARRNPKDEFYAARGLIHCLLDPDPKTCADARQAADNFLGALGVDAQIVREVVFPALRKGLPPKQSKKDLPRSLLLRDRWIAAVVDRICAQYRFNPTRNNATERECACSIVARAAKRLGIKRLGESQVATIWRQARQ